MIRNQDHYNLNEGRHYPLADTATALDDAGRRLPPWLLADLHVAYPRSAGQRVCLGSCAATRHLVGVVLLADDAGTLVPLASISLPQPVEPHRQYPLEPLYPGAGGWVVFGRLAAGMSTAGNMEYHGRFSTPQQALLLPGLSRGYRELPIPDVAREGQSLALTGLVRLSGGGDLEIVKECREIPAYPPAPGAAACSTVSQARDVIVLRLREPALLGAASRNVQADYLGPCGGRPESRTCGPPEPIELLGAVTPDCCGNVNIRLRGCARLSEVVEEAQIAEDDEIVTIRQTCGVVIDCSLGLEEACVSPDRLPDLSGRLPHDYPDLCGSVSEVSVSLPPIPPPEESESFQLDETSESLASDPGLPFCDDFETVDPDFIVRAGQFDYVAVESGLVFSTEGSQGVQLRNVAVWDHEFPTLYKRVSARLELLSGLGQRHNGAVLANYQETSLGSGRFRYYLAEIDWDAEKNGFGYKAFRIARFDGQRFVTELAVPVPTLALGSRYDVLFSIFGREDDPDGAWLQAELYGVDQPGLQIQIGPLAKSEFAPALGRFGMGSASSATRFHQFCVENTLDDPVLGP